MKADLIAALVITFGCILSACDKPKNNAGEERKNKISIGYLDNLDEME